MVNDRPGCPYLKKSVDYARFFAGIGRWFGLHHYYVHGQYFKRILFLSYSATFLIQAMINHILDGPQYLLALIMFFLLWSVPLIRDWHSVRHAVEDYNADIELRFSSCHKPTPQHL